MFIGHVKVSDAPDDGNPDHIQGEDWNQEHRLGYGALFPLGVVVAGYDAAADALDTISQTAVVSYVGLGSGFMLSIELYDFGPFQVGDGSVKIFPTVSIDGAQPAGHISAATKLEGQDRIELRVFNNGVEIPRFQNSCVITVVIYAEVVAPAY